MIADPADLPLWAAIAVAFFLLFGASLALIGAIGFLRLPTFYQRIHPPTLGTSWGIGGVMMASMRAQISSFALRLPSRSSLWLIQPRLAILSSKK